MIEIATDSPAGRELASLLSDTSVHTVRLHTDGEAGSVKLKANEGMWTPPLSTTTPAECSHPDQSVTRRGDEWVCGACGARWESMS